MTNILHTNCPNCGAPLNKSHKCEYCNTIVSVSPQPKTEIIKMEENVQIFWDYDIVNYGIKVKYGKNDPTIFIPNEVFASYEIHDELSLKIWLEENYNSVRGKL